MSLGDVRGAPPTNSWAGGQALQPGAGALSTRRGPGCHSSSVVGGRGVAGWPLRPLGCSTRRRGREVRAERGAQAGKARAGPGLITWRRLRRPPGISFFLLLEPPLPSLPTAGPSRARAPRGTRPPAPRGDTHFSPETTSSLPSLLPIPSVSPEPSLGPDAGGAAGGDAPGCGCCGGGGGCCCGCCCCCGVPPLPSSCRISEGELDRPLTRGPAGRPPPPHHG